MMGVARTDASLLGRWWWTVDRWTLSALIGLMLAGIILVLAASPSVADRIGVEPLHFVERHLIMVPVAMLVLLGCSMLNLRGVRTIGFGLYGLALILLIATLMIGPEINGAHRWLPIGGFSFQPSELAKPGLVIVTAWVLSQYGGGRSLKAMGLAIAAYLPIALLIVFQPDLGTTVILTAMWLGQVFIAGLPLLIVGPLVALAVAGGVASYFIFPHVSERVDVFLDPTSGDAYQIETAMNAFARGGLLGRGPGEGRVKELLPDAHSDFIFAVAGEEFGLIVCLLLVALFAFIVLRGLTRLVGENNMFVMLGTSGLLFVFGLQALVNLGSTVALLPTKGMTLPFVSYGGTALVALAVTMGLALALTRRRADGGTYR